MFQSWIPFGTGLDVVSGLHLDMPGIDATTIVQERFHLSDIIHKLLQKQMLQFAWWRVGTKSSYFVFDQVAVGTKARHVHAKFAISSVLLGNHSHNFSWLRIDFAACIQGLCSKGNTKIPTSLVCRIPSNNRADIAAIRL
jgi:hypothetical protein